MNIDELRTKINETDAHILELLKERMSVAAQIGQYKKENRLPIFDKQREREILSRLTDGQPDELAGSIKTVFSTLFEVSRAYQASIISERSPLSLLLDKAIKNTPEAFPEKAVVACQGVEGAYSQTACDKLFSIPDIMYLNSFQKVFGAVDSGLCRYGILPLENSTAGSVNEVYDLMNQYSFYIVRSLKLRIQHTLLAPIGTKLSDIKEIFSHEQALSQCSSFLKTLTGVKITPCENTASAAKLASESGRTDIAVISSHDCADLYGLSVLSYGIQNTDSNYTRFICISKTPEIYPGANKTSLMLSLKHRPGALYYIIAKFNALGINLIKLESRPIPGRDFEFMFYFDIDAPICSDSLRLVISELEREAEMFDYLGSYQEI